MTKTLELIVSPTGQVDIVTRGYNGSSCLEASRFLEQALGQQVSERLTAEFYQATTTAAVQQQSRP